MVPLEKLIKEIQDANINILKTENYNISDVYYADISILMINKTSESILHLSS
jgi:hypothetical protein